MQGFEEYIRQGEPAQREKGYAWQTAIGLQDVDGLKPSGYLLDTARQHIEGDITISEVKARVDSYYKSKDARSDIENRTEEADKVSTRIAEILSEQTFTFSPVEFITIHRRLFEGLYKYAGSIRDYNITKDEWVLGGKSVYYASAPTIRETLEYDFQTERNFSYANLPIDEAIRHIARFVSGIWQIHAFGEGNTRTTAVFTIKYLRTFGFEISNETFARHSWYFRNALVRANYNDLTAGIVTIIEPLELFFRNLILNEQNDLRNRCLHVDYQKEETQSEISKVQDGVSKCNYCTLNCTLEETALLQVMKENPKVTQKELALHIGKSERTVKNMTVSLAERCIIVRKNGKRNGYWEIIN